MRIPRYYLVAALPFLACSIFPIAVYAQGGHGHMSSVEQQYYRERQLAAQDSQSLGIRLVESGEEVSTRLAQAAELTAQGRLEEARRLYEEIAGELPLQGLPALGRFILLTEGSDAAGEFADRLDAEAERYPIQARARGLAASGHRLRAIELLRAEETVLSGSDTASALLLASLVDREEGAAARDKVLLRALREAPTNEQKTVIARVLFSRPGQELLRTPATLTEAVDIALEAMAPNRRSAAELIDPIIMEFQEQPGYFGRRSEIFEYSAHGGPGAIWFASRILTREERHEDALELLSAQTENHRGSALWPLLVEEQALLLRAFGYHAEATALLETAAVYTSGPDAVRLRIDAAQNLLAARRFAEALELLREVKGDVAGSGAELEYWRLSIIAASRAQDVHAVVEIYENALSPFAKDEIDFFHDVIFKHVLETRQHHELEALARERVEDADASDVLWLLVAQAALEARRIPNRLEALYQFAAARPHDTGALERLAEVAVPLAIELSQAPPDVLAIDEDEVKRIVYLAETALQTLIARRPYEADGMIRLMDYYKEIGEEEKAREVPLALSQQTQNLDVVAKAAYVLAINGYPEEALGLYDYVLDQEPDNMHVRMNRTACLTRLGRWDEAREFYRNLLENGWRGREYHGHEQIFRIWDMEVELGRQEEGLRYFQDAITRINKDWRDEATLDIAGYLVTTGYLDDAIPFMRYVQENALDEGDRETAWTMMVMAYLQTEKFAEALAALDEAQAVYDGNEELTIDLAVTRAEILRQLGEQRESLNILDAIYRRYPANQMAMLALDRAGAIAEEIEDLETALSFYQRFLETESTFFQRRQMAEAKVRELKEALDPSTPAGHVFRHAAGHEAVLLPPYREQ